MVKNILFPCLWAFLSSLVFCIIFNVKNKKIMFIAALGGGLGWFVYILSSPFNSAVMQSFFAAITVALFSEFMARMLKRHRQFF